MRRLLLCLALVSCGPDISGNTGGSGGGDGGATCNPACTTGQICWDGSCIPDIPCTTDDDCENDTYCQDGHCVPYGTAPRGGFNPGCNRLIPAGLLSPQIFCEWAGPQPGDPFPNHKQVLSTPLVVDFNFDNHRNPDNPTVRPSIVIVTYDGLDGACGTGPAYDGANYGIIRILDGRTCQQQYLIPTHVNGATTPAIGDIDGDLRADIVTLTTNGGLVAFKFDQASNSWTTLWNSSSAPIGARCMWSGPAIADLDDDGHPESILEGTVFDSAGQLVDGSITRLDMIGTGQFPVIADVDHDGVPELVSSKELARWNSAARHWDIVHSYTSGQGYVAVADFGTVTGNTLNRAALDGIAEIAVVSAGNVFIMSLDGTVVFGPVSLPGSMGGGPPTNGDFDNDGRAELAAAGSDSYTVFDPDCDGSGDTAHCPTGATNGILWSQGSQDHSSNITGSSIFDFEGDGTAEAVYADECFARIYDGRSGEVLFSQPHSSCTWNEYPIVADVAGNFRSKLLVPSNQNCNVVCPALDPVFKGLRCATAADCPNAVGCDSGFCRCTADADCNTAAVGGGFACRPPLAGTAGTGNTCQAVFSGTRSGVRVFGDVADRWVSSRPTWNEHTYSVTNVNDDGTIPRTSQVRRNWEQMGLNNFRMNVQGHQRPDDAPDVTARGNGSIMCSASGVTLTTQVCNRGTAPIADNEPVTFYEGTTALCTGRTAVALSPGQCTSVSCMWAGGTSGTHDVTIIADDDGTGMGMATECHEGNNRATMRVECGAM